MARTIRENKFKGIPVIDMLEKVLELEEHLGEINDNDYQWSMGSQTEITRKLNDELADLTCDDLYDWRTPFDEWEEALERKFPDGGGDIVNAILQHHLRFVDSTKCGPALEFYWNTKSPLYYYMNKIKDWYEAGEFADHIMDLMNTLADKIMNKVKRNPDEYGEWEQCGYCPVCDCWGIVPEKDGTCGSCGNTIWFTDSYNGGYISARDQSTKICKCNGLPKPDADMAADEATEDEEEEEDEEEPEAPAPAPDPKINLVDWINQYEGGELSEEDVVAGFQHLIDTGLVWSFQGSYGRMAAALIEAGLCH